METLRQMMLDKEVKLKTESELTKYKSRYKKLCELLKDAEGMFHIFILAASSVAFFNSEYHNFWKWCSKFHKDLKSNQSFIYVFVTKWVENIYNSAHS